jgi:hypothetical protein
VTVAELTRPKLGPEVSAKRDGTCKGCSKPVIAHESYIRKVEGVGWMHGPCATNYLRVIEAHEDDDGADGAREENSNT